MPAGMKNGMPPNTFNNNIFAYARLSMFKEGRPWVNGCEGASTRAILTHNIFYFDQGSSADFHALHGCAYTCGLPYNQFQKFDGNLYWRTDGGFANDAKAFHEQKIEPRNPGGCVAPQHPEVVWNFLSFRQWQEKGEDVSSTVTVDPGFGHSGQPSDFLLSKNPMPGFDFTKTNDTIHSAGRSHPVIMAPVVPATFPTYTFSSF
jgi:hypothetical protein